MFKVIRAFVVCITIIFSFSEGLYARTLKDIRDSNEIRLCTAGSAHQYYQEMGQAFADWLKVKAVVINLLSWDHQFHNESGHTIKNGTYTPLFLKNGQCDIYPNDLFINDWRRKKLEFAVLYQTRMVVLISSSHQSDYHQKTDLMGKSMAVMKNTTYHSWIEAKNRGQFKSNPVQITFMKTYDAWKAVNDGLADFTISNAVGVLKRNEKSITNLMIAFHVGTVTDVGWAYAKDNKELGEAIKLFFNEQQRRDSVFDQIWLKHGIRLSDYMLVMADML